MTEQAKMILKKASEMAAEARAKALILERRKSQTPSNNHSLESNK